MKLFIEEYGFAILATIVVIVLILMISPVGNWVKDGILSVVTNFDGVAQDTVSSTSAKLQEGLAELSENDEQIRCVEEVCVNDLYSTDISDVFYLIADYDETNNEFMFKPVYGDSEMGLYVIDEDPDGWFNGTAEDVQTVLTENWKLHQRNYIWHPYTYGNTQGNSARAGDAVVIKNGMWNNEGNNFAIITKIENGKAYLKYSYLENTLGGPIYYGTSDFDSSQYTVSPSDYNTSIPLENLYESPYEHAYYINFTGLEVYEHAYGIFINILNDNGDNFISDNGYIVENTREGFCFGNVINDYVETEFSFYID